MHKSLILIAALALTACETPYQPLGFAGGVSHQMLSSNTARISSEVNGYTSADKAATYALLHAAEITRQRGFRSFQIIGTDNRRNARITRTGPFGMDVNTSEKPSTDLRIRMFPQSASSTSSGNLFNAADVINTLRADLG